MADRGGYETAYIGKWHLYADELGNHFDPKNSFVPKGPDRLGLRRLPGRPTAFTTNTTPRTPYLSRGTGPEKIYADRYEPYSQVDLAIRHLKRLSENPDKPFAMFLSLGVPHDPWTPDNVPPEMLAKFDPANYSYPPNYLPEDDPARRRVGAPVRTGARGAALVDALLRPRWSAAWTSASARCSRP